MLWALRPNHEVGRVALPCNARAGLNHPYEARKELRGYCEVSAHTDSAHRHADRPDIGRARVPKIPGAQNTVKTGVDSRCNAVPPRAVPDLRNDLPGRVLSVASLTQALVTGCVSGPAAAADRPPPDVASSAPRPAGGQPGDWVGAERPVASYRWWTGSWMK